MNRIGRRPAVQYGEPGIQSIDLDGIIPEQLVVLKKADQDFAVRMRELDIGLERIATGDRDSSRRRETETKDWIPKVLAFVIIGGFFGVVAYVLGWGLTGMDAGTCQ